MNTTRNLVDLARRAAAPMAAALAMALLPVAEVRAAAESPSPLIRPYTLTFGSYFTAVDTDVSAEEDLENRGTRIDFESNLDFAAREELFRLEGQFLIKPRHQINFGYYELSRSASDILTREIEWRGQVFPVDAEVSGFFNTDVVELSYTWWWIANDTWVLGLNGGLQKIGLDIGVDLATANSGRGVGTDVAVDELVPLIGMEARRRITDQMMFRGVVRHIRWSDLGDLSKVALTDLSVGFEHQTFERLGIGLAFKLLSFDLDVEKRFISGEADYSISGVEFFFRYGFGGGSATP